MKIKKFVIENYKALKGRHEFEPDGHSFFLIGGNGQGKTSAGQAMIDLLTKKFPSQPVTTGEKEGYIEFQLDNGAKFYAKLSQNGKPKVEFITGDGINVGSPKELLSSLAGDAASFSIDEFLSLSPKPRREMMERIQGIDLSDLNTAEANAVEDRRLLKRQLKDQEARVEPYDKSLVGQEPKKPADLIEAIEKMNDYNASCSNVGDKLNALKDRKEELSTELLELQKRMNEVKGKIQEVDEQLAVQEQYKREAQPYSDDEINSVKADLDKIEEQNEKISAANRAHQEYERAKELQEKVDQAEKDVKFIRQQKEDLLQSNPLPADGLDWSEDGDLVLDGLPFESNQIATSRKVIAGLQIAEALAGKIRYLHFDASVLDHTSAQQVVDWAESKGLQLCLERALWEGGDLKFEVIDDTSVMEPAQV